ncbi:MAG: ABC transporter ATP-binding protein/permease [Actinomycetota bacterium]|nr:ABC transporter ATP-binding protein/permease [Actinomycetota bacterium]MDQ2980988.1 ABC transporter ATP-binding protein/permease [Actinomycetota bacterium]
MISTFLRFRRFLGRYAAGLTAGVFLTLASSLFALAQPWPLKIIVDSVLRGKPAHVPGFTFGQGWSKGELLNVAIGAYIAIMLLGALFDYVGTYLMDSSGVRLVADIRAALFSRMQRLSLRFHSSRKTGDLITRVMSDISRLQDMLIQSFSVLVPNVALLVGMMVVMFWIDWVFTLLALAVGPPLFLLIYMFKSRIKGSSRDARRLEGLLAARTGEVLGAIRIVQAFTREDFEDRRFSEQSSTTVAANLRTTRLQAQFSPLVDVLAGLGTAVVLLVGTHRVLSGKLSLGLLLVFLSYLGSLYKPMRQLSKLAYVSSKGLASAERVAEVLETEPDVRDAPHARPATRLEGYVRLEGVEFGYSDGHTILHDVELEAKPGQVVAIVGPTGAGKTTLVSLIPRFFDPQRGRVLIDGIDVRSLQLASLREQIAIVPQEPILLEGTIFENIGYGSEDATGAEIFLAAHAALVDGFAQRLPEKYATRVGERGAALSLGERQRISIARALVRDAPILILDEPTSALDPRSEHLLIKALTNLIAGRTTFVIAHRMSTVVGADLVVVLDEGRITESGTHEELMAIPGGLYRQFLDLQVRRPAGAGSSAATDQPVRAWRRIGSRRPREVR